MIVRLLVAGAVLLLALDRGSFGLESRGTLAIAVWWTIVVAVAVGLLPRARPGRAALAVGGLLAAFAAVTTASATWASSPEKALLEANRALLYLGVFVLVALAASRVSGQMLDGLAIGISAVGAVALATRCFPSLRPESELLEFLPNAATRLSYPIGYWNGLAMLLAVGVPALLRAAVADGPSWRRGLAVAPLPGLAAAVFLTSSRGAVVAAAAGLVTLVTLAPRRLAVLGAAATASLGAAVAVAVLLDRPELVDGPLASDAAAAQGRSAAVLLLLTCAATGAAYAAGVRLLPTAPRSRPALMWATAATAVVGAAVLVAAADPVQAFEDFKRPPAEFAQPQPDFVKAHLLSGGGSGRWQFWTAALDEFRSRPLAGRGAGSYEAWWAQHGSLAYFVRDAHSLYLETLGELGLAGLVLLLGAFAVGLAHGARAARRRDAGERLVLAGLVAAFAAYAVGAGIDWMWETTVVSVVGLACLGALVAVSRSTARLRVSGGLRAGTAVVGLAVVALQAAPLLAEVRLGDSRAAARRGDLAVAREAALDARALTPWAAAPSVQVALVEEDRGDLAAARRRIREALDRDGSDWRTWLVAARLDTKAGSVAAARRDLARARELNPRSPLFTNDQT